MTPALQSGFTLALGGGGGRGWAHIGVARALDEARAPPGLVVGTSMGAIVGAGIAAGLSAPRDGAARRRTFSRLAHSSGAADASPSSTRGRCSSTCDRSWATR